MEKKRVEKIEKRISELERKIKIWEETAAGHQMKLRKPSLSQWKRRDHDLQVQWREQMICENRKSIAKLYEERIKQLNTKEHSDLKLTLVKGRVERIEKRIAGLEKKIAIFEKATAEHQRKLLDPSLSVRRRRDLEFQLHWKEQAIKEEKELIIKYEEKLKQLNFTSKDSIDGATDSIDGVLPEATESDLALLEASRQGIVDRVNQILHHMNMKVDSQNADGHTALMKASFNGHVDVASLLLEKGAQVDAQCNDGWSALLCASSKGRINVVETLLKNGARVDLQDNNGRSSLLHACSKGHINVVETLLEKGAQVDKQDKEGWTPLMKAYQNGHNAIIAALLSKNANVHLENNEGKSVIAMALDHNYLTRDPVYEGILFSKIEDVKKETISSAEQTIENHGISLSFPENSLLPTDPPLELEVRPCFSGPFELPDDMESVSPAYIINPKRRIKFREAVALKVNHHANLQSEKDCEDMAFLSASCTPEHRESGPVYVFREIRETKGSFKTGDEGPIGEIALKHFCIIKIGKRKRKRSDEDDDDDYEICDSKRAKAQKIYSARLYNKENLAIICVCPYDPYYIKHCNEEIIKVYGLQQGQKPHTNIHITIHSDNVKIQPSGNQNWVVVFNKDPPLISKTEIELQESYLDNIEELLYLDYPSSVKMTVIKVPDTQNSLLKLQVKGIDEDNSFVLLPGDFKINSFSLQPIADTSPVKNAAMELEQELQQPEQSDVTILTIAKQMLEGMKSLEKCLCENTPVMANILTEMEHMTTLLLNRAKEVQKQFKETYYMEKHIQTTERQAIHLRMIYTLYTEQEKKHSLGLTAETSTSDIIPSIESLIRSITKVMQSSRYAHNLPNNKIFTQLTPPLTPHSISDSYDFEAANIQSHLSPIRQSRGASPVHKYIYDIPPNICSDSYNFEAVNTQSHLSPIRQSQGPSPAHMRKPATTPPDPRTMFHALYPLRAEWHNIGFLLGYREELNAIAKEHQNSNDGLREMIDMWFRQIHPPTWSELADAVAIIDPNRAHAIRCQFLIARGKMFRTRPY